MSTTTLGTVYINSQCVPLLNENLNRIAVLFSAQLVEKSVQEHDGVTKFDVTAPVAEDRLVSTDFVARVQVFDNSLLAQGIETNGPDRYFFDTNRYHIIGDSAFPLRRWIMTPYKKTHNLSQTERNHNKCLSSDRVIIENTFGHLKGRWRRLQFINCYNIAKVIEITSVGCILHNFCILHSDQWNGEVVEEHNEWNDYRENNVEQQRLGKIKRNAIATELNN